MVTGVLLAPLRWCFCEAASTPEEHHAKPYIKTYGIPFFSFLRFFSDKQDRADRTIRLTSFKGSGQTCNCISKKMKKKIVQDSLYTDLNRRLKAQIFMTRDFIFVFAVCAGFWHRRNHIMVIILIPDYGR